MVHYGFPEVKDDAWAREPGNASIATLAGEAAALPGLTPLELDELAECERVIEKGLAEFVAVGTAISIVRRKQLWRGKYKSLEEYLSKRFGISVRQAYRLCDAAEIVRNVIPPMAGLSEFVAPVGESQVRPLKELPADKQREAWAQAIAQSNGGRVTARTVQAVVNRMLGRAEKMEDGKSQMADNEGSGAHGGRSSASQPRPAVIDLQPALSKEGKLKLQADITIRALRELLSIAGTADSQKAAGLMVALDEVQDYRDHVATLETRKGVNR